MYIPNQILDKWMKYKLIKKLALLRYDNTFSNFTKTSNYTGKVFECFSLHYVVNKLLFSFFCKVRFVLFYIEFLKIN